MTKTILLAISFLLAATSASASAQALRCQADFDESSHYELEAAVEAGALKGPVALRYVTEDGLDLRAEMKATAFRQVPGELLQLKAANESMALALDAVEMGPPGSLVGRMTISFSLDHAEDLELSANCALRARR